MKRAIEILSLIILLIVFSFSIYVLWLNLYDGKAKYSEFSTNESFKNFSYLSNVSYQFYPNMRYRSNEISYLIDNLCTEKKKESVMRAFEILSEKTILRFYPGKDKGEIIVLCSNISNGKLDKERHFIAGEGGASEIINATVFAIITEGKISLYREERCEKPKVAIHEIFHALGFEHNNNTLSILYPVSDCEQEIDDYLVEEINRLYSIKSEPDLVIESISANRTGIYLNYVIKIANYGLRESKNATLKVFSGDKMITNYDLAEVGLGMKRIITAQNIKLGKSYKKIEFVIEPGKNESDLDITNNKAEIFSIDS
ncbi:MAG: M12 family metallopeptidase [Candidatus Pacearchaeota archaeon]|nr:M12 family metallopeptidase [Candidatus Pacearchaeota archaeon]